ncbi:phosphate ABC transporter substrate-binding protein PstS family protein [Listeria booriae]|uniref:Phosphate-binding protein n=1 Tax=Listeria booriae TaxID=1552123 RepID=A0A7X0WSH8_9LIST|nr:phosphate ABC transporter substrate-binding protein PstS family protein [Listeria booriae]MBC1230923.1 phosphate ABC transporter substrate-binding protein PstS family protein [Listeria booriae]MBC1308467.1 phosphate ABC transporter substrate-binding protein PstS family protein [Listeria booriae]MBC1359064.1 phosphate ABC transporter substrate-binding protein PstS family protein [Listeria booriae]MBC1779820.1 phosphate ABC transporter substrate-binding protein PstS family protein [Listeria bo
MKKRLLGLVAVLAAFTLIIAGCGNSSSSSDKANGNSTKDSATSEGSITAVGSTALQPLVEAASKQYTAENPKAQINVQGGGSGTGLTQVQQGAVDIGNSDVFAEEKDGVDASKLVDHRVAVVGMAPVVNKDVGVKNISKQQLIDIFTGKVTNWKEVGGKDEKITVINRAEGSGTRATFEKWGLDGATPIKAQEQDSSGTVRKIVSETPGAISYLAFSYIDDSIQGLSLDNVEPKEENVATNDWKIWAYEHMYTNGEPKGLTKSFLEYITSEDVQNDLVPQLGYQSIHSMKVERSADGKVTDVK